MRPQTIDEFVGQEHLLGEGGFIRQLLASGGLTSLILWGPPGTGKTTLARIITKESAADFVEISAVTAKLEDVRKIVKRAEENQRLQTQTVLFVDEIHRFNKAQQDAFLPHVESGLIILIGATTENPSFEVIRPLLSRSRVLVLEPLGHEQIKKIIDKASKRLKISSKLSNKAVDYIVELSHGDARTALNILELSYQISQGKITTSIIASAAQKHIPGFDKGGEMHYNLISAYIKSLRGGDTDAAYYYLARMLEAGEDPKFIARRMIIFASEDIGTATNGAVNLAIATFQAVDIVGMPEAKYNLFHCTRVLAASKKSRQVTESMGRAMKLARDYPESKIPLHLRNAPTELMGELGYGEGYEWKPDFKPRPGFMPEDIDEPKIWVDNSD